LANTVYAMLHNTLSPTMLKAGERLNVIPSVAEGWIDGRILPGQNQESFRAEILGALGDLPVDIEFLRKPALALESPPEGELFDTICEVIAAHEPAAPVVPILLTGGTDAKHLAPAGVRVYGFWPMREDPQARLMEMAHNHDERISLANLRFGVHVLYHVIKQFCAA
jgi:acetylornithine deacetylase/succinyl-diaminopimelate desuccinylase-like protein